MLLCADADAASADLASGALACPSCGSGRLRQWGRGRERVIRLRDGARARLEPAAGPVRLAPGDAHRAAVLDGVRRADAAGDIAAAAVASALHGPGAGGSARNWASRWTVRGWPRRLRVRAGAMRQDAMSCSGA